MIMDFFKKLKLKEINSGVFTNQWVHKKNSDTLESTSPIDGKLIAKVICADEKDYEHVLKIAEKTFLKWREVPAPKRGEIIRQIGDRLRHYKDALGSLVSLEMGKSKQEGDGEVQEMIDMADFAVGQSRMLYGKMMQSERAHHRMYEQWQPLGIVGIISAFNFPVAVWAWNAFLAGICGNVSIWKPSHKVSLCAIAVMHICEEVLSKQGFSGLFTLFISKDHEMADHFIADSRVSLISFTGSTKVGRHVGEVVSARFGKVILELGGNNAIIVDETADLKLAIPAIVFGAIGTAGQRCTSTRRVIVQESIAEKLILNLIKAYKQIKIGNPLDEKNLMGPLIDAEAVHGFTRAIDEIKKQKGRILFGGQKISHAGFYVEPTIVKAENDWPIVQQETFAPILYIMTYKKFEEAILLNNAVQQGLSSALFTTNLKHAEYFLSHLGSDCGIANINIGTSGAEIGGAFGGEKETGGGRESGSDAWKAYMRRQTNTINWSNELPLAQGIKFNL